MTRVRRVGAPLAFAVLVAIGVTVPPTAQAEPQLSSTAPDPGGVVVGDDFERGDSAGSLGVTSVGGVAWQGDSGWQILGGRVNNDTQSKNHFVRFDAGAIDGPYWVRGTVGAIGSTPATMAGGLGALIRTTTTGSNNGYYLSTRITSGTMGLQFYKVTNGSFTPEGTSTPVQVVATDELAIFVGGPDADLVGYLNGVEVARVQTVTAHQDNTGVGFMGHTAGRALFWDDITITLSGEEPPSPPPTDPGDEDPPPPPMDPDPGDPGDEDPPPPTDPGEEPAPGGVVVADDFERADSAGSLGVTSVGGVAWQGDSGWQILGGRVNNDTQTKHHFVRFDAGVTDGPYWVHGTVGDIGSTPATMAGGLGALISTTANGSNNGYYLSTRITATTTGLRFYKVTNGSFTPEGTSTAIQVLATDELAILVGGPDADLVGYLNGAEVARVQTVTAHQDNTGVGLMGHTAGRALFWDDITVTTQDPPPQ